MALHRDGPDDFVTQPIDQLLDEDDPSDALRPPPSLPPLSPPPPPPRHSAPEGIRRFPRSLWSAFRKGGVWWKVLVVFVVLWTLGHFGNPAPQRPAAPTSVTAPACPTPSHATH